MQYDILRNNGKVYIHPVTIIMFNVFLPVINTFFPTDKGIVFSLVFVEILLFLMGQRKTVIKTLVVLASFFAIYLFSVKVLHSNLLFSMLKMTILFLPSYVLACLLIGAYHLSEVFSGLQKLRLPKIFVVGLTVTIRYIPTFVEEFKLIKASMQIRGLTFSLFRPIQTFEYLIVPQLFRCLSLSGELTSAALTKGIEAPMKRVGYFDRPFGIYDLVAVVTLIGGHTLIICKFV